MNISEQVKNLCKQSYISKAELARRLNLSPQAFNGKLKRESFSITELESIAEAVGADFEHTFILHDGKKI